MTTEARRSSLPPGPPPSSGPRAGAGWSVGSGIPGGVPGAASADGRRVTAAAPLGDDPGDEPSVFTPRGPADTREPVNGTPRSRTVPEAVDPVSPPPPPASARFPDTPPRAARPRTETAAPRPAHADEGGTRTGGTGSGPGDRAGAGGSGQPGADGSVPSGRRAGRTEAPARTTPGTAAPLPTRPLPEAATPPAAEDASETTARLRPVPPGPPAAAANPPGPGPASGTPAGAPASTPPTDAPAHATRPSTRWHPQPPAPRAPDPARTRGSAARPHVTFGEPDLFRTRRRGRAVVAGVCLVLGLGLIGGAVAGSWIAEDHEDSAARGFAAAVPVWHSVPVDTLFPPVVQGAGDGPGGADRTWTRIAVAPDGGCADAFDPLLWKVLADAGCRRLLRATYTDATQSYVTTVGLLFTKADPAGMSALATRFRTQHLAERPDLVPRPYAARNTPAAGFGDDQRATWTISVRTDAPVVVYAVSGWADGRSVDTPQPAADAVRAGATSAQAQSGLGDEARGLSGQIAQRLRRTVGSAATNATKRPS
ncbi:hypothetical protein DV517_40830 [Streptomyces sp. S816]|uniref:hypothetical protein n=1 Tax=Streptomyces sp. S816 TaxID=2283197 RepID=UPI00113CEB9C|nr:hypothetical protein [Streptomyces sp. S816]TGZ19110.1 hypothetical protein DV517_40830 [Streptomyces sp. S816]